MRPHGEPMADCVPAVHRDMAEADFSVIEFSQERNLDDFVRSRDIGRHSKKLQMQGARILRIEAYIEVRRNDLPC